MANAPPLPRTMRPWRETARWAQAVMALCWLVPWYRSMTPGTYASGAGRTLLLFLGVTLGAHYLARAMHFLHLRLEVRRLLLFAWMVGGTLFGLRFLLYANLSAPWSALLTRPVRAFSDLHTVLPDELFVIAAVVLLTWRGTLTAEQHVGPRAFLGSFRTGVFMFLLFALVNTWLTGETPGALLFVFLFAAMVGMTAARLSVLGRLRGGRRSPFDRNWVLAMGLAAVLTVGAALFSTRWVDSQAVLMLGRLAAALAGVLMAVIALLLLPLVLGIVWLLLHALSLLQFDLWLPQAVLRLEDLFRALAAWGAQAAGFLQRILPDPRLLKPIFLWGLVAGMAALALFWLGWRIFPVREVEDLQDSRGQWDAAQVWQFLWERWRRRAANLAANVARLRQQRRALLRAIRVRRVYADFVAACAARGVRRPPAVTPLEFIPLTSDLLPASQSDVRLLTEAYLRVRYGELPEREGEVLAVEGAWRRLQAALEAPRG